MQGRGFVGSKYDRDVDVKEIAKRLRTEIKEAVKKGELPQGKYSVTIDRYSMGQSIDIRITELEGPIMNPGYDHMSSDPELRYFYAPKVRVAIEKLREMKEAYNRDNSDIMTDYFDVKFYGSVDVDYRLLAKELKAA